MVALITILLGTILLGTFGILLGVRQLLVRAG